MSSVEGRIAIGYINSKSNADHSWPDLYFILGGRGITPQNAEVNTITGTKPGSFDKYYAPYVGKDAVYFIVDVCRPKSNPDGSIRLASKNHEDKPLIDPLYLRDSSVTQLMTEGM